jgi:transposase
MSTYLGADWSATNVVCSTASADRPPQGIAGAVPSLASVRDLLERVKARHGSDVIDVIIEAGAEGWIRLFQAAGAVVHVVDPKQARRFAESRCSSGAKDDARDSVILALMGLSPAHLPEPWAPPTALQEQLHQLGTEHERLTHDKNRVEQRIRDILRRQVPLIDAVIRSVTARWIPSVLPHICTGHHAKQLNRAAFDELFKGTQARHVTRDALWKAITETEVVWPSSEVAEATRAGVVRLIQQAELLREQLAAVDGQLDQLTKNLTTRKILQSAAGVGLFQAVALMEFAFDEVPEHRDQAAIRIGAAPVFSGSGRKSNGKPKGHVQMRRAAAPRARRSAYLVGRLAMQHLEWGRAMYADAMTRGQSPSTAFRRIARCMLRILTAMLRDNKPYDDAAYVARLKEKGIPWALRMA